MFVHNPSMFPSNFIIVGAGGTGARAVQLVSQLVQTCEWLLEKQIWLVDGDEVESKNLRRQLFIEADLNQKKAAVIAQRYSAAFGINITPICQMIDVNFNPPADFTARLDAPTVVILCVDSVKARKDIIKWVLDRAADGHHVLFIDAGNEDDFGQVTFFHGVLGIANAIQVKDSFEYEQGTEFMPKYANVPLEYIPFPMGFYENMQEGVRTGSCADLDQTLAINAMAATTITAILQSYLYRRKVEGFRYFFGLDGGMNPSRLNIRDMVNTHVISQYGNGRSADNVVRRGRDMFGRNLGYLDLSTALKGKKEADMLAANQFLGPKNAARYERVKAQLDNGWSIEQIWEIIPPPVVEDPVLEEIPVPPSAQVEAETETSAETAQVAQEAAVETSAGPGYEQYEAGDGVEDEGESADEE